MVLAEAMAACLPVISTDCGGAPEVLGADAFYFRRGDYGALAGLLDTLYGMPASERENLGERLSQRLEVEFSPTAFRRRLFALPPLADGFGSN